MASGQAPAHKSRRLAKSHDTLANGGRSVKLVTLIVTLVETLLVTHTAREPYINPKPLNPKPFLRLAAMRFSKPRWARFARPTGPVSCTA